MTEPTLNYEVAPSLRSQLDQVYAELDAVNARLGAILDEVDAGATDRELDAEWSDLVRHSARLSARLELLYAEGHALYVAWLVEQAKRIEHQAAEHDRPHGAEVVR